MLRFSVVLFTMWTAFSTSVAATPPQLATDTAGGLLWTESYHPGLGRFMAPDPQGYSEANLHSFNRYAYANNNPYRYVDPDGNTPIDIAFLAYDIGKLGIAIYSNVGIGAAVTDVVLSAVGVVNPIPGTGQAIKAAKAVDRAVDVGRAVEHGVGAMANATAASSKATGGAKIIAKDGTEITGFTKHGIDRAVGDGASRAGTKPEAILDAVRNPSKIKDGLDAQGRPFKIYQGENARVVMNPESGKIISTNPLSRAGAN